MPAIEEYCEVSAGESLYRNWTSVAVNWGMSQNWFRTVMLQCEEVASVGQLLRLTPGDPISVSLAGRPVITNGRIRVRQAAFDANRHGVQITGWGSAGEITESSAEVDGGQFRNYSLSAIGNRVLQRHGLKLSMHNPPKGADKPFDNVMIQYGETVFAFIERLARQRDCFIWASVDGTIKAGLPDGEGGGDCALIEGVNILAANCTITDPAAQIRFSGQDSGSDQRYGSQVSKISATATIGGFKSNRLLLGLAEEPVTKEELQARVNRETRELLSQTIQASVTHAGWFKPGTQELWSLGETVTLKSPMLIPTKGGSLPLRVWDVTWSQDAEAGTVTSVILVNEAVFSQQFPNAGPGGEGGGFVKPQPSPPKDDSSSWT